MKEIQSIVTIVFKALALAMGVATLVLNWMGNLDPQTAVFFLSLGLVMLAITALQQPNQVEEDRFSRPTKSTPVQSSGTVLTEREHEIVTLLGQALSNREIAERLFLAEGTVKNYLTTLMQKLGADNRDDVVNRARQLGLL